MTQIAEGLYNAGLYGNVHRVVSFGPSAEKKVMLFQTHHSKAEDVAFTSTVPFRAMSEEN